MTAQRPKIVCLCGSTRFYEAFQKANYDETMAGKIVLTVGCYAALGTDAEGHVGEGFDHDSATKVRMDELHMRKIDLADEILVLDVGGYIGESTTAEVLYALKHGKRVRYLSTEQGES